MMMAGVQDGSELTLVRISAHEVYRRTFADLIKCADSHAGIGGNNRRTFRRSFIEELSGTSEAEFLHVSDDVLVADSDAPGLVAEIARCCECNAFPCYIGSWLEVLILSGKIVMDTRGGPRVVCRCKDFVSEDGKRARIQQRPGLLYLTAPDDSKDTYVYYMVDLHGQLGRGKRAVWYASVAPSLDDEDFCPRLEVWQRRLWLESFEAPVCVALDLTQFFSHWACNGTGPPRSQL